jgi:hypothetical protein
MIVEIAGKAAHFNVIALADDDGIIPTRRQFRQGQVRAGHERTRRIMNLLAREAELEFDSIGRAMSGQQNGLRLDLAQLPHPDSAGLVELRDDIGIVNEIAEDGHWAFAGQFEGETDGVANAEAHAMMLGHADDHARTLLAGPARGMPARVAFCS